MTIGPSKDHSVDTDKMKESAAHQMLSSAPPEQWGSLLEVLGASFRPISERCEDEESPCTVTSLLGMIGQEQFEHSVRPETSTAPSNARRSPVSSAKARARRAQQRSLASEVSSTAKQEDTRDLDDLLRHLGEVSAPAVDKKAKKKKAASAAKQPRCHAAEPLDSSATGGDACVEVVDKNNVHENDAEAEDSGAEMVLVEMADEDDDDWQTVAPRTVRKVMNRAQEEAERLDRAAQQATQAGKSTVRAGRSEKCSIGLRLSSASQPRPDRQEGPQGNDQTEHCAATIADDCSKLATCEATSVEQLGLLINSDEADIAVAQGTFFAEQLTNPIECMRSPFRRSLSVGAHPLACDSRQGSFSLEQDVDPEDAYRETPPFHVRPSVATWLRRSSLPASSAVAQDSLPSSQPSASSTTRNMCWHARPSVGTWLGSSAAARSSSPRAQRPRDSSWHARPSVGTWLGQPSHASSSQEHQFFWPPTPDASPEPRVDYSNQQAATASDFANQQVVWVPVPMHLLAEVQQVLNRDRGI